MPRPRPLTNLTSALPDEQQALTPRTPHSRTARAEGGFAKLQVIESIDDQELDDIQLNQIQQQSAPLLASSSSDRFAPRGQHARNGKRTVPQPPPQFSPISRLMLTLGVFLAAILLVLIFFSLTRPEALHRYIGAKIPQTPLAPAASQEKVNVAQGKPHPNADPHLISYENYTHFPLHALEYRKECEKLNQGYMAHGNYWDARTMGPSDVEHKKARDGCTSTITYMMDGDVGLFADLGLLAQAAALARDRNRTFFVDDTNWNRGKWTDHFEDVRSHQPGPEPGCKPPPPEELVACPRTARHWVINFRTAKFHFSHGFSNYYEDAYAHNLNRLQPIFKFAVDSFQTTIRPGTHNNELIHLARSELSTFMGSQHHATSYVAIHVRRGDRKPASYEYHGYIPTQEFAQAANHNWRRLHPDADGLPSKPIVYVASDSPSALGEFLEDFDGQTFSLFESEIPSLRDVASPGDYYQQKFSKLSEDERVTATRGMIVDFAMLSGMWAGKDDILPVAALCSISSNVCRLTAVGLGWERAFGLVDQMGYADETNRRWVDVDQKGRIIPIWEPFELF